LIISNHITSDLRAATVGVGVRDKALFGLAARCETLTF